MKFIATLLHLLTASAFAGENAVSYYCDVAPILKRNCYACHRAGKAKGQLNLTSFAAITKGGKHGESVKPGDANGSRLLQDVSGDEPEMPEDGDPLDAAEIALLERWITEGARDDTPADAGLHKLAEPPIYRALPSIPALAWSPDGNMLAVSGYHEVILQRPDGQGLLGRLGGYSQSIVSLAFSPDGKLLATAGGVSSEYGEIQLWDVAAQTLVRSIRTSNDTLYGVSFSPDGTRVAVGGADKLVRVFTIADGREIMKCDNHIDWVFGTAFSQDGTRLVSASRDRVVKLIDIASGHLIDDVNKPRESLQCLARHPREDLIVFGDDKGSLRIHKMEPRGGRLAINEDNTENSSVRDCHGMPSSVTGIAWSPDGNLICAVSSTGVVCLINALNGMRSATLTGHTGAAYAVTFSPDSQQVATGGQDGQIHIFETAKGEPIRAFGAVPLTVGTP